MGQQTGIAWTDHTFNPWWGCTKVSPACAHCYAETFAKRVGLNVWGASERRFFGAKHWAEPLKWNRDAERDGVRRRVFCASMADVFEDRPDLVEPRADLFALIEKTEAGLDWLVLTKRPENIARLWPKGFYEPGCDWWPHLWLGATTENQAMYDARIGALLRVPSRAHFLSIEPMLSAINLRFGGASMPDYAPLNPLPDVDWVICGGESGAQARPVDPAWVRSLRDQCVRARVAFFFKQWGGRTPKANGHDLDGREWLELPRTVGAVDPQACSTGTLTPRDSASS